MRRGRWVVALALSFLLAGGLLSFSAAVRALTVSQAWTLSGPDFATGTFDNTTVSALALELTPRIQPTNRTLVLVPGSGGSADSYSVTYPTVMRESNGMYKMWYMGNDGATNSILLALSPDGYTWTKVGVVLSSATSVGAQDVLKVGATYHMWYEITSGGGPLGYSDEIYHAISSDGIAWTVQGLALGLGATGAWDSAIVGDANVFQDGTGLYRMYYSGWDASGANQIGVATSHDLENWSRFPGNPVLPFGPPGTWDNPHVGAPSVAIIGSTWVMYYHANRDGYPQSIGRAISPDGYNWSRDPSNPVIGPEVPPYWDDVGVGTPDLLLDPAGPRMYFYGYATSTARIGVLDFTPPRALVYTGNYTSEVFDTGHGGTTWSSLSAGATVPTGTSVAEGLRVGNRSSPDATWSGWMPAASASSLPRARYAQISLNLTSTSWNVTPSVTNVTLEYMPDGAPVAFPHSPAADTWTNTPRPLLGWNQSDPEADPIAAERVQISPIADFSVILLDSGNLTPGASSWQVPYPLPDGIWYWRVQAQDVYGAWSLWKSSLLRLDTAPPSLQVLNPSPGQLLHAGSLDVVWTAADSLSGSDRIEVSLDGTVYATVGAGNSSATVNGLSDGPHTIRVRAFDRAGNAASVSLSLSVDTAVLSVNGPYGAWPLASVLAAVAIAVALVFFFWFRRRKPHQSPESKL